MMADAGLADERDVAAEFFVACGDEAGVFVPRHDVIGIAIDVQQRHLVPGQRDEPL